MQKADSLLHQPHHLKSFMRFLLFLFNFILYSNLWIAAAAVCMSLQTQYIYTGTLQLTAYHGLLFFGTVALYAAHRLIGLQRILSITQEGRFVKIRELQLWVALLAMISAALTAYCVFQVPFKLILWILPAGIVSGTYVLPLFKNKQRLRDVNYIKIFLIALVWAWLTASVPAYWLHQKDLTDILAISLERFFFIFAITLPFDIRDLKIDTATRVKTLPSAIGIRATKNLAYGCLIVMMLLAGWSYTMDAYSLGTFFGLLSCALLCFFLIKYSTPQRPDYYYTAFMDGTMILQFLLVVLFTEGIV
jgi:4-hydroxybenzoate polyprenyltransferase